VSEVRRRAAAGLTLIEFLFATSIMAFVALGVAGMFPAALRSVVTGGHVTKATALAREMAEMIRLEAARSERFDSLISDYNGMNTTTVTYNCLTGTPSTRTPKEKWKCDIAATTAQESGSGLPAGYGTVAVACINANGTGNTTNPCPTDLRRVTVTVTWERTGSRSVSVVTNVARPNPNPN
jgi:Tfp pilus assembly protein PilV